MTERTETIERTVTDTRTFYVARDGAEFTDREKCAEYEASLKCALRSRFSTCMHKITGNEQQMLDVVLNNGNDDSEWYRLHFMHEDEVTSFVAWASSAGSYVVGSDESWWGHAERKPYCIYTGVNDVHVGIDYILSYEKYDEIIKVYDKENYIKAVSALFDFALTDGDKSRVDE